MSDVQIYDNEFSDDDVDTFYLSAGPQNGPLIIFIHGWPGIAETWKPQLEAFASHGFHVVCTGVANLNVPYHTLEYGLYALVSTVNRDTYPIEKYPNGQWDYQVYYETNSDDSDKVFEADVENSVKILFRRGDPATYGKPALTSSCVRDGGWFGGKRSAPEMGELSKSVLDEDTFEKLCTYLKRNGFFGASAWYRNHAANEEYSKSAVNGGVLDLPVLFVEGKYDAVCATPSDLGNLSEPMRKHCRSLTEASVEGGHWIGLERPVEVNAAIEQWLRKILPDSWPGNYQ